jgi:hypothetical protein
MYYQLVWTSEGLFRVFSGLFLNILWKATGTFVVSSYYEIENIRFVHRLIK